MAVRRLVFVSVSLFALSTTALASPRDAVTPDAAEAPPKKPAAPEKKAAAPEKKDPCAAEEAKLAHRKAWLEARRQEQFEKGGVPNPDQGIPNMIGVWCENHPDDEECGRGNISIEVSPDELGYDADATPEDRDPHVILMKRALRECRERQKLR